jgi:hypothetical protein
MKTHVRSSARISSAIAVTLDAILLVGLLAVSGEAGASRIVPVTKPCPIGGEVFTSSEAMSGTSVGRYLDFRLHGLIVSPWPLPKCPGNGFVIYKGGFSPQEIAKLTPLVKSAEYQNLQHTESNYYLAAYLRRKLGASRADVAFTLLEATWETYDDPRYPRYAAETLAAMEKLIADHAPSSSPDQDLQRQMIAGELERRLGRFEPAQRRFGMLVRQIGNMPKLSAQQQVLADMVEQELDWIEKRNTQPQKVVYRQR